MNQARTLYQLQKIDLEIFKSRKRIAEIDTILANDEALLAAQSRVTGAKEALTPLQARLRDLELETQSNEEKTRSSEQQLYSGAIKNPKEMQDTQQEIESLKRRHSDLETMMLETMMAVEEAEGKLDEAEVALASITASRGDEHRQLLDERNSLDSRISELQEQRLQVLTEVEPENLKIYDTMKVRKHNQPIAVMEGNTCGICGVAQTVTIEREVRQGRGLVRCSNCERILVNL